MLREAGLAAAAANRRAVEGGAILVAPRDASFYADEGRNGSRYHTVRPNEAPACDSRTLVVMEMAKPLDQVASTLLCRRAACVNARRPRPAEKGTG
jgi:hypothetical protein